MAATASKVRGWRFSVADATEFDFGKPDGEKAADGLVEKFNPNHDAGGRFSSAPDAGGSFGGGSVVADHAKTLADAESHAQQFCKGKVSYRGISVGMANEINSALDGLFQSGLVSKFEEITAKPFKGGRLDVDAPAATEPGVFGGSRLVFNTKILGSEDKHKAFLKRADEARQYVKDNLDKAAPAMKSKAERVLSFNRQLVDDSVKGIVTHEFGHHLDNTVLMKKDRSETRTAVVAGRESHVKNLSARADANAFEYIAESFVAHRNGETIDAQLAGIFKEMKL